MISIIIQAELKWKKIQIINTYAPHMGYDKTEQMAYRGNIKKCIKHMSRKHFAIWATYNNGRIAYGRNNSDNINEIWPRAYAEKRKGNGETLKNMPPGTLRA